MCLPLLSIHLLGFCKLVKSANIRYFCEKSMNAHAALVLKIHLQPNLLWIFLLENYEAILAKFSSYCVNMLSLSYYVVVLIFCKVGQMV